MLNVYFTVDVEVWCGGWKDIDVKFPQAFQKYIYGPTPQGEYGLRHQLKLLRDHGLYGVFFVEPLFATRFGIEPLTEIIGLILEYGQEVQLHMHPEWVDESTYPLLPDVRRKRPFMRHYSLDEQTVLIAAGIKLISDAGGGQVNAFRAGSFGFNLDTLSALAANNITFDSSYNASYFGAESGLTTSKILLEPIMKNSVMEFPMTVFDDGTRSLRHTQLGAISTREMEGLLFQSLEQKRTTFVILSHNFELMNRARDRADKVVVERFRKLCQFLDENRDVFRMAGFKDTQHGPVTHQPNPMVSPFWKTGLRMLEQFARRRYG
jgi:hypothetical protein